MFLDLNSYFASVEQAVDPSLRGRAIAVAPTPGDGGTIIAASYEAKAHGIRTGTKVGDAKQMCPAILILPAQHTLYVHFHDLVLSAVESVLPIDKVCSIDEMRFRLLGDEMGLDAAKRLAHRLKEVIYEKASPELRSSIGIAPNAFLAKLATEFEKPNGLVTITVEELPGRLDGLKLTEFPGINRRMEARLMAAGIFKSDDMVRRSAAEMRAAFGSVVGERWYYLLQGYDLDFQAGSGKSLGHSHVLPPEFRTDAGAREVLLRLIHKACMRLRSSGFWAEHVAVSVSGFKTNWTAETALSATQDALVVQKRILKLWEARHFDKPQQVGVTFTKLKKNGEQTFSLFEASDSPSALGHAVDDVNRKFGKNSVFLASLAKAKDHADEKIAFNKTWLLSEGKGDNVYVEPLPGNEGDEK